MPTDRTLFLDVAFDTFELEEILARLGQVRDDSPFGYLVTPNVDHIIRLHNSQSGNDLATAYREAAYCLCDSKILARLARLCGIRLRVIPGSDLTEFVFRRIIRVNDRIAVVGGDAQLIQTLRRRFPYLDMRHHAPPMGLAGNAPARSCAAAFIAEQRARFTFICVGSPQQELIAAEAALLEDSRGLVMCVGAALDFLTGREIRAPRIVRYLGLEWAHRLLMNPRKLWRRYLVEGPRIFLLTYRWAQKNV